MNRFVYFVATKDRSIVKIGCSGNPKERMWSLKRDQRLPLELIAFAPGDFKDEKRLHEKFMAHHIGHEWFNGHEDILRFASEMGIWQPPEPKRPEPIQLPPSPMKSKEVAMKLGVSMQKLAYLRRTGRIRAIRLGGRWRYHRDEIKRFIRAGNATNGGSDQCQDDSPKR